MKDFRTFNLWAARPAEYEGRLLYGLEYPGSEDKRALREYHNEVSRRKAEAREAWLKAHGFKLYHGDGGWKHGGHADNLFSDVRSIGSTWIDHDGAMTKPGAKGYFMFTQPYPNGRPLVELVDKLDELGFEIIHAAWDGWHFPEACPLIVIAPKPGTPLTTKERKAKERESLKSLIEKARAGA